VLIPERESDAHLPAGASVERPGVYFLQIGSYKDAAMADRVRLQAQKLGVSASVQRIVVDAATWHRVRVGPIRDLTLLNRVRHQLQAGNLAALVVRVNP
jgi:cell division protein FtsN